MLGASFREFRLSKGYTIKELATTGVSESTISRFEKGEVDLGVNHLQAVLEHMHEPLSDWITKYGLTGGRVDNFESRIGQLYSNKNVEGLENEFYQLEQLYSEKHSNFMFKRMTNIANFYFNLTGEQLLSKPQLKKFAELLFAIETWDSEALDYFGNSTAIMTDVQLLLLEKEVIAQLDDIRQRDYLTYIDAWTGLLNGYIILIEHNQKFALEIQPLIMAPMIEDEQSLTVIRRYVFDCFLKYKEADSEASRLLFSSDIIRAIAFLNETGITSTANQFTALYTQICHV